MCRSIKPLRLPNRPATEAKIHEAAVREAAPGSARGTHTESSDVDLGLYYTPSPPLDRAAVLPSRGLVDDILEMCFDLAFKMWKTRNPTPGISHAIPPGI